MELHHQETPATCNISRASPLTSRVHRGTRQSKLPRRPLQTWRLVISGEGNTRHHTLAESSIVLCGFRKKKTSPVLKVQKLFRKVMSRSRYISICLWENTTVSSHNSSHAYLYIGYVWSVPSLQTVSFSILMCQMFNHVQSQCSLSTCSIWQTPARRIIWLNPLGFKQCFNPPKQHSSRVESPTGRKNQQYMAEICMGSAMQRAQKTPDGSARFSGLFKVGKRDPFLSRGPATNAVQNIGLLWGSSTVDDFILQLNIIEINIFVNAPTGSKISGFGRSYRFIAWAAWLERECCWTNSLDWHFYKEHGTAATTSPRDKKLTLGLWVCKTMGWPKIHYAFLGHGPTNHPSIQPTELVLKASGTALSSTYRTPHRWGGHASRGRSLAATGMRRLPAKLGFCGYMII